MALVRHGYSLFIMPSNNYKDIIDGSLGVANSYGSSGIEYSFLEQWLTPGVVQQREFGQQVALEQLQYEQSIDYKRQIDEMKKAGINPNTAAEGIAKSPPSTSAPSVPSSPSTPTPSDFAGALSQIASGVNLTADSIKTLSSLDLFRENLKSDTVQKLTTAGLNVWNARSIAELLPGMKSNQRADFYLKLGNINKVRQEYQNLLATHNNIIAEYDAIIARKDLDISQSEYFAALKARTEEDTRWMNQQNEFFAAHKYSPDTPLDVSLRNSVVENTGEVDLIGNVVDDYYYKSKDAEQRAVEDHAYGIAYEAGRADYDFNWSSPPKTITEFLWKSVGNLKDKLVRVRDKLGRSSVSADSSPVDISTLRNSYIEYKGQLTVQYERLNAMRAEYADRLAAGENQKDLVDLKMEISKLSSEIKSLPQNWNDYCRYLKIKNL